MILPAGEDEVERIDMVEKSPNVEKVQDACLAFDL